MRVAVTGSTGRLGRALVAALADAPFTGPGGPIAWTRADLDLDAPAGVAAAIDRDRPEVVVHAAAWTDVDGCARDPELAIRRNAVATGVLAIECATRGIDLLAVSTNEVFDGLRTDGRPYGPGEPVSPGNPYGVSKAKGEAVAQDAYRNRRGAVGIARTAWLYGPPGVDYPRKIAAAAHRAAAAGEPLRLVADEWGQPTYAADVADAIVELLAEDAVAGIHHLVAGGIASRATWATDTLERLAIVVPTEEVPATTWQRASMPPPWGVLAPTPLPSGEPIRPWTDGMADYLPILRRLVAAA
ncbi:MAG TPA: NAD(P)-dependent oxidoreductase [Candidatus Limnocylindrales bacterium]